MVGADINSGDRECDPKQQNIALTKENSGLKRKNDELRTKFYKVDKKVTRMEAKALKSELEVKELKPELELQGIQIKLQELKSAILVRRRLFEQTKERRGFGKAVRSICEAGIELHTEEIVSPMSRCSSWDA